MHWGQASCSCRPLPSRWYCRTLTVELLDAANGQTIGTFDCDRARVQACALDTAGHLLAAVCTDGSVRLWDLRSRSRRITWLGHLQPAQFCAFSQDGRWLATGAADGTLRLWPLDVDDSLWERWLVQQRPLSLDESLLAWKPLELPAHAGAVTSGAWAGDGSFLLTASNDRSLRLWLRGEDSALHANAMALVGHGDEVVGCAISSDATRIASVTFDGEIKVWRSADAVCLATVRVDGWLSACVWAGDGSTLLVAGARGLYTLGWVAGAGAACAR